MTTARVLTAPAPAPATRSVQGPVPLGRVDAPAERDAEEIPHGRMPDWSFAGIPLSHGDTVESIDVRVDGQGRRARDLLSHDGEASAIAAPLADAPDARIHTGPAAADTARRAGAHALTTGADILFAAGRFAPRTTEGAALLAHELRHVAQQHRGDRAIARRQGKPGAVAAPATTLTGLPEGDRKRIQAITDTPLTVTGVHESFDPNAKPELLPAGTTLAIDASARAVPAGGLRNIIARLIDATPSALPKNTTMTLRLALGKHGGVDGLYRLTYHSPPVPPGGKAADRVLVEQLGPATAPPDQAVPSAPEPGKQAPPDPVATKLTNAGITHSLTGARLESLRGAVSLIPASQLAIVKDLAIVVGTPKKAGEDGDYDSETHTVTLKASIFSASDIRASEKTRAVSYATQVILHEIGHAIDFAPLRAAQATFLAAGRAQNATVAANTDANGHFPLGGKEQKAIEAAAAATKTAKESLQKTRGRSGVTASVDATNTVSFGVKGAAAGAPFREAVKKDGVAVSKYGQTDWSEAYAEAFALYTSSPEVLQSLRPATFDFLKKALP